jgi:hypothetical protein
LWGRRKRKSAGPLEETAARFTLNALIEDEPKMGGPVTLIDVEHESELLKERSRDLAAQLDAAIPTVDRTGIREALAESRRLAVAADEARADIERRLSRGQPPGVQLGPHGPVRRVKVLPNGRDAEPFLRGRIAVTSELVAFHRHRIDVVAAAFRDAYTSAGEQFERCRRCWPPPGCSSAISADGSLTATKAVSSCRLHY